MPTNASPAPGRGQWSGNVKQELTPEIASVSGLAGLAGAGNYAHP
jgi:hypothetical protein